MAPSSNKLAYSFWITSCAATYISSGQKENARAVAREVLRIDSELSVYRFGKRRPFKNQVERERLIDALPSVVLRYSSILAYCHKKQKTTKLKKQSVWL